MKRQKGLRVLSPAKVNLFLEVIGKRPDGFHELESVMQAISLYDTLDFESIREGISIETDCSALQKIKNNLVYRAAAILMDKCRIKKGVRISLQKRIPIGGGLGGGSSNAAATLIGLNKFWGLKLSDEELSCLGMQLGSDVPFFIYGKIALIKGRGEIVFPIEAKRSFHYLLLAPPIAVPTKNIYAKLKLPLTKQLKDANVFVNELRDNKTDNDALKELIFNRLESVAIMLYPILHHTFTAFQKIAKDKILMSGSGSTLFKICKDRKEAQSLADLKSLRELGRVYIAQGIN